MGENPDLDQCTSLSCEKTAETQKKSNVLIPIVASVSGSIVLMIIVAVIVFSVLKRKKRLGKSFL